MCMHMGVIAHRRPEDNLQELGLSFYSVGSGDPTQVSAWQQVPLSTEPSHQPLWF